MSIWAPTWPVFFVVLGPKIFTAPFTESRDSVFFKYVTFVMEVYNQPKFDASLVAATCELRIAFIGKLDEYPDYLTKTIKHLIFFCWENRRQNQLTGPIHRQNPTIYRVTFYLHTLAGCFCISETWTLPDYHYILRYDCFRPPGIWCELDGFSPPWN